MTDDADMMESVSFPDDGGIHDHKEHIPLQGNAQDCPLCMGEFTVAYRPNDSLNWKYTWHCVSCGSDFTALQLIQMLGYDEVTEVDNVADESD